MGRGYGWAGLGVAEEVVEGDDGLDGVVGFVRADAAGGDEDDVDGLGIQSCYQGGIYGYL